MSTLFLGDCNGCVTLCYHYRGTCFHRYCGADNWFDARSKCKKLDMNLAVSVLDNKSHPDLQGWMKSSSCSKLWLGYSKEDWYYPPVHKGKFSISK